MLSASYIVHTSSMLDSYRTVIMQTNPKKIWVIAGYLSLLTCYNVLAVHINGWQQWILVSLLVLVSCAVIWWYRISSTELGLARKNLQRGLLYGVAIGGFIAVGMILAYVIQPTLFTDSRYSGTTNTEAIGRLLYMLFRTVIVEELVFRGILLALFLRKMPTVQAVIASSLLFGLWHIMPSLGVSSSSSAANTLLPSFIGTIAVIAGIVVATGCAGALFCFAKIRSNSLVAPIIVHWTINGVGLVLAMLSVR